MARRIASQRCSVFRHPATGKVLPWRVRVDGDAIETQVAPALCTNDEIVELQAVLAGEVIGQVAGVTAAPYIRSRQLIPLLTAHIPDTASYFAYFASRSSQPARFRTFIDLAVKRLANNPDCVLSPKELAPGPRRALRP